MVYAVYHLGQIVLKKDPETVRLQVMLTSKG